MFQIIEQRNLGYFELRERLIIPFSLWCLASCISLANQDFVRQPASQPFCLLRSSPLSSHPIRASTTKMSAKIEKIIVRLQEKYVLPIPSALLLPARKLTSCSPESLKANSTKRSNKPASSPRGTSNPRPGTPPLTSCSRSRNPFSKQVKAAPEAIWASS